MENILSYLNTFSDLIFGDDFFLDPSTVITYFQNYTSSGEGFGVLFDFLIYLIKSPGIILSTVVWVIFAILIIKLALTLPYKLVRTVVRSVTGVRK